MMIISSRPAPPRAANGGPRSGLRGSTIGLIVLMACLITLPGISLGGDQLIRRATAVHELKTVAYNVDAPVASKNSTVASKNSTVAPADHHAELLTAIRASEALVSQLWLAVEVPMDPIESKQWLIAYFRQGWGPAMAMELAAYYSYTKGQDLYLRYTDDLWPGLDMALAVNVVGLGGGAAVVKAEFSAIDGPVRYYASSRLYSLIQEEGTWKVAQMTIIPSEPQSPPTLVAPPKQGNSDLTKITSRDS